MARNHLNYYSFRDHPNKTCSQDNLPLKEVLSDGPGLCKTSHFLDNTSSRITRATFMFKLIFALAKGYPYQKLRACIKALLRYIQQLRVIPRKVTRGMQQDFSQ